MDILSKARSIISDYDNIMSQMMDSKIMLDQDKMTILAREKSIIDESYELSKQYVSLQAQLRDLEEMKNDREYEDLVREESIIINSQISIIEEKYIKKNIQHSYSKEIVFLEDYAFLINALSDLSDKTMNFKYKDYANKLSNEAFLKFYVKFYEVVPSGLGNFSSLVVCVSKSAHQSRYSAHLARTSSRP